MSDPAPPPSGDGRAGELAGRWGSLFQQSSDAVFLLNRRRRLRFVNRAWEALTGQSAEASLGLFCLPRKFKGEPAHQGLARTLAPPPEVLRGRAQLLRRPVPPARLGPPWWDIQFLPLTDAHGLLGVLGRITPVGEAPAGPARSGGLLSEGLMALRQQMAARHTFALLESAVPAMSRVAAQARAAARNRAPVWIVGAPGTGKETLARVIHHEGVTREETFLAIDCAGLQPFLVRNMLFGHTGLADSGRLGTIYLKDPGSLAADVQDELLEWWLGLEDGPRVIAGTAAEPTAEAQAGRVSTDFVAAFGIVEIRLPSLCERRDDVPRLIEALAAEGGAALTPATRELLPLYSWPGNLRELRIALTEAARAVPNGPVEPQHVPLFIRSEVERAQVLRAGLELAADSRLKLGPILEGVERNIIRLAIEKTQGNQSEAAGLLGLTPPQLGRRLRHLKLQPVQARPPAAGGPSLQLGPILETVERNVIRRALQQARGDRFQAADLLGIKQRQLNRRLEELGLQE